jgi:RHH-type proline utilization regulon transcriptional repressor/proline dehydrogenase/delta 1-pyrroline-5-carboxylate dehydrogenase
MPSHSQKLKEAREMIHNVKGRPLSIAERKRAAVDLAALLLQEAEHEITRGEKKAQQQLFRLMQDPVGKAFTTAMTDECFRSSSNRRTADQIVHLLSHYGVPNF